MATNNTNQRKIIYPELSYAIMGILFTVHNELGTRYQEKHYQRAIEIKFKEAKIPYMREQRVRIPFGSGELGIFILDFVVEGKIILEIKQVPQLTPSDVKQVLRYLRAMNLKLGIIANFRRPLLEYRRVLN